MKKNLRIVSAAAAALLAVAPVAVSVVSTSSNTVFAKDQADKSGDNKVIQNGVSGSQPTVLPAHSNGSLVGNTTSNQIDGMTIALKDNGFQTINANTTVSSLATEANVKKYVNFVNGGTVAGVDAKSIKVVRADGNDKFQAVNSLTAGNTYYLQAQVQVGGLKANSVYTIGSITGDIINTNNYGITTQTGTGSTDAIKNGFVYVSVPLHAIDTSLNDKPFFKNASSNVQIEDNGTVSKAINDRQFNNTTALLNFLKGSQSPVTVEDGVITTTAGDIAKQLSSQGTSVNADGNFQGNKKYTITLTAMNVKSGKTSTVKVDFNTVADYTDYPVIAYNGSGKWEPVKQGDHYFMKNYPAIVLQKGSEAENNGKKQFAPTDWFKAYINTNYSYGANVSWTNNFEVVENNVNTEEVGVYKVTVKATNNAGKTTELTVPVFVQDVNGTVKNVKYQKGFPVPVYAINGDTVVRNYNNYDFLYDGDAVSTYGTKTVNGVEYTRLQSPNSNVWIESKNLAEGPTKATGTVTVMHNSFVYNEKGERVGTTKIATYSQKNVYGTKEINGKKYYKISADKEEYINAANVDGTKRTLKHNAYIYATSKKRANKKVLKKGTTVTTYGSAVKFRNGKAYYRIEGCTASNKMYVKKANF